MHELQKLSNRHQMMVEDCLLGMTRKQIAEKHGMTPEGIGAICKSPAFQDELARERSLQRDGVREVAVIGATHVRDRLTQASMDAADRMIGLMGENSSPEIQLRSSQYILDRVLGKDGPEGNTGPVVQITADQMTVLVIAMKESQGKDILG